MKTTIKDVAEYCKISVGTVDRALNDRQGISQKTKERILQAMEQLNYHPNHTGRSLAKGKTMTIGVVCFDLYNNFFPELIDTIEARAKEKGYFIYLILTHRDFELEKQGLSYLCERQVDGIILFPIGINAVYQKFLNGLGIPIVTIYNKLDKDFSFVGVNDKSAMEDAVRYMADKGYQKITYLTPDIESQEEEGLNTYTLRQRAEGYLNGIQKFGLKYSSILAKGGMNEKIEHFIQNNSFSQKTALLCLCDSYAIDAMNCLQQKGIQIPEQVGIMGYDNIESLKYVRPRITTIQYSVLDMGRASIDILFQSMEEPAYKKECLLKYSIIEGYSLI